MRISDWSSDVCSSDLTYDFVAGRAYDKLVPIYQIADKIERQDADDALKESVKAELLAAVEAGELPAVATLEFSAAYKSVTKVIVRGRILSEGVRMDGRGTADIRPLADRKSTCLHTRHQCATRRPSSTINK